MSDQKVLRVAPLTAARFADFCDLFGARGACGGCWCMTPRLTRKEYEANKGEGNRAAMQRIVESGQVPGVLGYLGREPIGWCAIEPRERLSQLSRSRILKPVDDAAVHSIVCLFVRKDQRRRGRSLELIEGAVAFAAAQGAQIVEAYPVEPKQDPMPDVFAYTGIAATFRAAGFVEVARRSPTRPILRRILASQARRRR